MAPTIVCGIDDSSQARAALHVASALAQRLGHRLIVAHAVPAATPDLLLTAPVRVPAHFEQIDLLGYDTGERLLSQTIERLGRHDAEPRLERGGAAERLCGIATEADAEFIVVGSRGAGALHSAIFGSVSTAVVRDAPCATVVVPPGMTGPPLRGDRIVCAIHTDSDAPAVATATRLARDLDLPLSVAHVLPNGPHAATLASVSALREASDQHSQPDPPLQPRGAYRLLARLGEQRDAGEYEIQLRNGDPASQLLELTARARAMLLVIGSRGLGPVRAGLLGSVSRELVRHATVPVVICRQAEPS